MSNESEREARAKSEARVQGLIIAIVLTVLTAVIGGLIRGLFSKNKTVRISCFIGLVALAAAIGFFFWQGSQPIDKKPVVAECQVESEKYDWPQICQTHWQPAFEIVRESLAEFGGFELAQPPVSEINFASEFSSSQNDVPVVKPYRYFEKTDLEFKHGALVKFKLKVNFGEKYSESSIEREFADMKQSIVAKFEKLSQENPRIVQFELQNPASGDMEVHYKNAASSSWTDYWYGKDGGGTITIKPELYINKPLSIRSITLTIDAHRGLASFIDDEFKRLEKDEGEALPALKEEIPGIDTAPVPQRLVSAMQAEPPESVQVKDEAYEPVQVKEETSTVESDAVEAEPDTEDSEPLIVPVTKPVAAAKKSPHIKEGRTHDWPNVCREEWGKNFEAAQGVFSEFGGFSIAQAPYEQFTFSGDSQENVPLASPYRHFATADLDFLHGALVRFTLKAHLSPEYSKASVEREFEAMKKDVAERLQRLHKPEEGIKFDVMREGYGGNGRIVSENNWPVQFGPERGINGRLMKKYRFSTCLIYTSFDLDESGDGYDMVLTVDAQRGIRPLIDLVIAEKADNAGLELPSF